MILRRGISRGEIVVSFFSRIGYNRMDTTPKEGRVCHLNMYLSP